MHNGVHSQLFCHVTAIPWQASIMRAQDFFFRTHSNETDADFPNMVWDLYQEINTNTPLGRRLYALAIEIQMHITQSPIFAPQDILHLLGAEKELQEEDKHFHKIIKEARGACGVDELTKKLSDLRDIAWKNKPPFGFQKNPSGNSEQLSAMEKELDDLAQEIGGLSFGVQNQYQFGPGAENGKPKWTLNKNSLIEFLRPRFWRDKQQQHIGYQCLHRFNMGTPDNPQISFHLVYRCSSAGFSQKNASSRGRRFISTKIGNKVNKELHIGTLGRYSSLVMRLDEKPLCRCTLPDGNRNQPSGMDAPMSPLFMHRETWIELKLDGYDRTDNGIEYENMEPVVILYVRLHFPHQRMDFINWLNTEVNDNTIDLLRARVYLTDGWADLAILISTHPSDSNDTKYKLVEQIFGLKDWILNNFMCAKTETVFTDYALELVSTPGTYKQYSLRISLILKNPKRRRNVPGKVVDILHQIKKTNDKATNGIDLSDMCIFTVPGRTDIEIYFMEIPQGITIQALKNIATQNEELMCLLDKVESIIGLNRITTIEKS